MNFYFSLLTPEHKKLPLYIAGIGHDKPQRHVCRDKDFPYYQFAYCTAGKGIFGIDGKEYTIEEGMMFCFEPGIPHEYYMLTEDFSTRWIIFMGADMDVIMDNVNMQTEIKNDSNEKQNVKVINKIFDADKNPVTTIESAEQSFEAGQTYNFNDTSDYIQNPNLWSSDHPYLYTVHTDVQVDGQSVDQYDTTFGFRWAEFTADKGFFLNGELFWIDGADAHQDHAGWANAVTVGALKRDVAMIKEAGLNFIRGSHYPHSPAYAEACDERGILFWSEASFWGTYAFDEGGGNGNSEDYKADGYPTTGDAETEKAFEGSCMANVRDMIRVNRNHPSIIVWSMGNEVFFGTNHDKKKALISRMAAYAKELDTEV